MASPDHATPQDSTRTSYSEDTIPPRPVALPVRASGIPHELRQRDQWVTWAYTPKGDGWDKPPQQALRDALASSTDPKTWAPFAAALTASDRPDRDGVGFVVSAADPYTIIDLDECRAPATGAIDPAARALMDDLGGYWEVSPSGCGLRGVVRATLPGAGRNRPTTWSDGTAGRVELYSDAKYLTMTGHVVRDVDTIPDAQAAVEALYAELDPPAAVAANDGATIINGNGSRAAMSHTFIPSPPMDDAAILATARRAKNADRVERLWQGDKRDYLDADGRPDDSRADAGLLEHLAYYTQDRAQLDRLLRQSALYRAKWERPDYRERTITYVLSRLRETYQGQGYAPRDGGPCRACQWSDATERIAALEAENRALKADKRDLLDENAELRRRESEAPRIIQRVVKYYADKSTRGLLVPLLLLWQESREARRGEEPPLIIWNSAQRAAALGESPNTVREHLKKLEAHGIVDRTGVDLGGRSRDGDWREQVKLRFVDDPPDDLADALDHYYAQAHEPPKPRKARSRRGPCKLCPTAQCPTHPDARVENHITPLCTECGGPAGEAHYHQPTRPRRQPLSPVTWVRLTPTARPAAENGTAQNLRATPSLEVARKNCAVAAVPVSLGEDLLARATVAADALAATLEVDALPPAEAVPLRLAILRECAQRLRAGDAPPTPTETCDTCGVTLQAAEFLRCDGCATAGVAS